MTASVRVFAVFAAGGTGGHVYPAIAVADALAARGHARESLRFVTDSRAVAVDAVARAGYASDHLPVDHGFARGRGNARANARVALDLVRSTISAFAALRRHEPAVVVGFGAYASIPTVVAARARRIPVLVHEQNARAGVANRVARRLGARTAVSIPGTDLAGAVVTGNPVRADIAQVAGVRTPQEPALVARFGGSQGSATLNAAMLGLYDAFRDRDDVAFRHVCGRRYHEECRHALDALRRPGDRLHYELVEYEHDMAAMYASATLLVMRASASVAEVAAAGVPSVLVPWPGSAEDHQIANAQAFAAVGAAVHLPEPECDAVHLGAVVDAIVHDPLRLAAMADAARVLGRPDAADRVADLVEEVAGART